MLNRWIPNPMVLGFVQAAIAAAVALALAIAARRRGIALLKETGIALARGIGQIVAVGAILVILIEGPRWTSVFLLAAMIAAAARTSVHRTSGLPGAFGVSLQAILLGAGSVVALMTLLGVIDTAVTALIPVGSMVIANAMNGNALALERFRSDVEAHIGEIETALALGADGPMTVAPYVESSVRASLIPSINNLRSLGIVWIPGLMAGMVLSGAQPLYASIYQFVVIAMILGASGFTALIGTQRMSRKVFSSAGQLLIRAGLVLFIVAGSGVCQDPPANRWIEVNRAAAGARRGSAIRYVPEAGRFFLWGYMNDDPDLLQELPLMRIPEYDMVTFDPGRRAWRSELPPGWEKVWSERLPLAYIPRTYAGITTGSERTRMHNITDDAEAAPRPDLNIVFDQVTYVPETHSLLYFTGGLTAAYDVTARRWKDLAPRQAPPPVMGGSLAYDPVHREVVLFGGGHVAETGPDGRVVGYTGTWAYAPQTNEWRRIPGEQPPPRMNTRLVCDTRNQVLVLFGGDGQSRYLADTWLFDLKTRKWRRSQSPGGPPARAGHFTVYDPVTGWVIAGGGYNQRDLHDMWAYDAAQDRWRPLAGEVPASFYLSADIAPEERLLVLVANTRAPGDRASCNVLFPVRTTYIYRIDGNSILGTGAAVPQQPVPKRPPETAPNGAPQRLDNLPVNRWVLLAAPGRRAPIRTWGSAAFDTVHGRILNWGGGHCGYGGSDVDAYDPTAHTWRSGDAEPEYPERAWNQGVRLAGVTFGGRPWTDHGRKIYAYDPVSRLLIMTRPIRLTSGYDPEALRSYPSRIMVHQDALVRDPSSYEKTVTWTYDPETARWEIAGPAPVGLDTLAGTPQGVIGVTVNWPARLNDAGYQLPWSPDQSPIDNGIYLYHAAQKRWERLDSGPPSPQNLYEMTSLAYDTRRNQVILHGGGQRRGELWTFDLSTRRWKNQRPAWDGAAAPAASREAVYLPRQDAFLTLGKSLWVYRPGENRWRPVTIPLPLEAARAGQNRAMVYDARRDLVLLVVGGGGDEGRAAVYALRWEPPGN